jgi:hypothetical protein
MRYWFETRNTIPNAPRSNEDELLSGGRFIAVFAALSNREYFDSEDGANGFEKRKTRKMRCTIGLKQETQYQTYHGALKMSFRRDGDLLPSSGLCQIASILIQKMGPTDLERRKRGE